ncbi:MAG: XRE family transcriptional regulator [Yersinia sp. (in: enterobacteria)]
MQSNIGERLRKERERLGLSQLAFGELGGVKKLAQLNYEKGDRYPDAQYLAALARFGVDVQYVVTGDYSVSSMPQDEARLVELYRAAPIVVKAAVLSALTNGSSEERAEQVIHGDVLGNVIKGNVTMGAGSIMNKNTKRK